MATRARQEEELVESTSEKDEIGSAAASEEEPVVVEEGPVTVGKPVHEGKTETPKEGVPANVAVEGRLGDGPFWALLARAGYKPW